MKIGKINIQKNPQKYPTNRHTFGVLYKKGLTYNSKGKLTNEYTFGFFFFKKQFLWILFKD